MATEFDLRTSVPATNQVAQFFREKLEAELFDDMTVEREGMQLFIVPIPAEEQSSVGQFFGFAHRTTVTYRLLSTSNEAFERNSIAVMESTISFLSHFQGEGVLLFNGETVVLQRIHGEITLDCNWEEFTDVPELAELAGRYELRSLPQPLH